MEDVAHVSPADSVVRCCKELFSAATILDFVSGCFMLLAVILSPLYIYGTPSFLTYPSVS